MFHPAKKSESHRGGAEVGILKVVKSRFEVV